MHMALPARSGLASTAALLMLLMPGQPSAAQAPGSVQTLCVLDFQRLGNDSRSDWLQQGLADLMIGTLGSTSPYLVVERRHLREILQEQRLATSGLIDVGTAVRGARLARAELVLLGSFVRHGDDITIQVRLIRVSDQRNLAETTWTGRDTDILAAPGALTEKLLAGLAGPPAVRKARGIEVLFPTTIDEARSYYLGVAAFDDGRYPEALAHYLDSARRAGPFGKAQAAALDMYSLVGRSDQAVLFARELARSFEIRRNRPAAVEYYVAAAREALGPLNDQRLARTFLEQALALVAEHDRATGSIAGTKRAILRRIDELQRTGLADPEQLLSNRDIRHQIWIGDLEAELTARAEEQARGGIAVLENGQWIKRAVPPPTLLMWKIRTLGTMARASAELGEIGPALDRYHELLDEYAFLTARLPADGRLLMSLRTEAHFMLLRHYARTGQLVRNHRINRLNKLNLVANAQVFLRDFGDPRPDMRARVASRFDGRGYEYFDFAAPPGHQIDALTLRVVVNGIAELSVDLPQPNGSPPRYSLSSRLTNFKLARGSYTRTTSLPAGTEFVSLGTGWGPGLFSNTQAEVERWKSSPPADGRDIARWDITFRVSPKRMEASARPPEPDASLEPAVQRVIERYAAGWTQGPVVRDGQTTTYSGSPRLDVYGEDWLVYSLDGDVRIVNQRDVRLEVGLPIAINTREREFDPSLVRTHDGRYALLWARGTSRTNAARFVAYSEDLVRWETPQRLVFENPPPNLGYTYSQAEPLERTFNVVGVRRGYAMLLAQGFVRRSDDMRTWGPPRKELPQDLDQNRIVRGHDGTVWAIYATSSPERQPYTETDWLSGFFVVDGQRYRHVMELRASRSVDGVTWQDAGKVTLPGQSGALWAFAVDEGRIGIGLAFNNLYTKWFDVTRSDALATLDVQLPFMQQSDEAACFVRDAQLTCVRPMLDPVKQKPMLLVTTSDRVWGGATR
jgi:TolB-like protein